MFLNRVILSTLKAFNSKTGSHIEEHLVTLMLCRSFGTYFSKHLLKEPFLYCTLSHEVGEGSHGYCSAHTAQIALCYFSIFLHFSNLNGLLLAHRKSGKKISLGSRHVYSHTTVQLFWHIRGIRAVIQLMAVNCFKKWFRTGVPERLT